MADDKGLTSAGKREEGKGALQEEDVLDLLFGFVQSLFEKTVLNQQVKDFSKIEESGA